MAGTLQKASKGGVLEVSNRGPVHFRITPIDAVSASLEIGIDYSQAEPPTHHYDADYCDVVAGRTGIALIFGKLKPQEELLRTKIEIEFSRDSFLRQVWMSSRQLHAAAKIASAGQELVPLSGLPDPEKVQCFRANNVFMACLINEAVLDFYYLSPGEIYLAHTQKKPQVDLESVVRVVASAPLMLELLDKCAPFAAQLEQNCLEEPIK